MTDPLPLGRVESDVSHIPPLLHPSASDCDFPQVTYMEGIVGDIIIDSAVQAGANALQDAAMQGIEYMIGRPSQTSGVVTTAQYDVSNQYRYKRMPKYKKKRWVKGLKRQDAMDMSKSATQTVVLSSYIKSNLDWLNSGKTQNWMCCHLYGMNGVPKAGNNQEVGVEDLKYIRNTDYRLKTQKNTRVKFESAVMDITIRNPNEGYGLEVDVYDISWNSTTRQPNMVDFHTNIVSSTLNNGNIANSSQAQWDARGITPFDTVQLAANGARIISKRKVFLKSLETFTYQYRDPKNHYVSPDDFDDITGYVKPYTTRTLLFIFKSIVGEMKVTTSQGQTVYIPNFDPALEAGITRIYKYKIKGEQENGMIYQ